MCLDSCDRVRNFLLSLSKPVNLLDKWIKAGWSVLSLLFVIRTVQIIFSFQIPRKKKFLNFHQVTIQVVFPYRTRSCGRGPLFSTVLGFSWFHNLSALNHWSIMFLFSIYAIIWHIVISLIFTKSRFRMYFLVEPKVVIPSLYFPLCQAFPDVAIWVHWTFFFVFKFSPSYDSGCFS